jgi:hypothetical protein
MLERKIYNITIQLVVTCGCETWSLNEHDKSYVKYVGEDTSEEDTQPLRKLFGESELTKRELYKTP